MSVKMCKLYDRECIDCGECQMCDLDPSKKCDNCMNCITHGADYRAISVNGIMLEKELYSEEDSSVADSAPSEEGLDWDALMEGYDT